MRASVTEGASSLRKWRHSPRIDHDVLCGKGLRWECTVAYGGQFVRWPVSASTFHVPKLLVTSVASFNVIKILACATFL